MNKGRLILGISLIILAATIFFVSSNSNFGTDDNREDNGIRTVKTEAVENIHSIKADGVVSVHITKGDTEQVRYEYNEAQFKNKSTFEDGALSIDFSSVRKGFNLFSSSSSNVDVYVTVKDLKLISMDGVGTVKTTNMLTVDELDIRNEGTGSMKIEVTGNVVNARNTGVGSLRISGSANTSTLSNTGVGSMNAGDFIVQILSAKNDGVGSMQVYAEKEISLQNSGVGSLYYSGDAVVKSKTSEGVGSISKR